MVFQNDFIMEGTLAGNIRFCRELPQEEGSGRPDGSGGLSFKRGWPSRGGSGGKQPVRRSEAAVDHCGPGVESRTFLVLDDASSALDYRTDAALRQALRRRWQA